MDEMGGCHIVQLAKDFKSWNDREKFDRWNVMKCFNGSQKCPKKKKLSKLVLLQRQFTRDYNKLN